MRLATIVFKGESQAAIVTEKGILPITVINEKTAQSWPTEILSLIAEGKLQTLNEWLNNEGKNVITGFSDYFLSPDDVIYDALYRHPSKIWGIGLNYVDHASDLSEKAPSSEPASFMKPDTTIIGHKDTIKIPYQSERTTAEAEMAIIIGKECKNVSEEEAPNVIAGFTTIIDMTAEDILQKNPRYLTRSKSFDTFFSVGPQLVTPDEVEDVLKLNVSTIINGNLHRKNIVENMTFRPWDLVSFHSKVMTLKPGDIISTGTPGAVPISEGDQVECHIDGFEQLINPVKDLKATKITGE